MRRLIVGYGPVRTRERRLKFCFFAISAFIALVLISAFEIQVPCFFYGLDRALAATPDHGASHAPKAKTSSTKKVRRKKPVSEKKDEEASDDGEMQPIGGEKKVEHKDFDESPAFESAVDAVLVLDASRSMMHTDPARLRDQGAKLFVRFLSPEDRVAIVEFSKGARVVYDLTFLTPASLLEIDEVIDKIGAEGGFTDLQIGLESAFDILNKKGRNKVARAIVLLSDGKMDPHPSRGTAEFLIDRLTEEDMPNFRQTMTRLYTLSLSDQADQELLAKLAKQSGGLHWFTPTADSIHKRFSELFLTLKNPQILPLEGEGFEVDAGAQEVTFYISRKEKEQQVSIINPLGYEIRHVDFPSDVKWFKGDFFDIVTFRNPVPGMWAVQGIDHPEGFATLLSNVKLQVRWPPANLRVGDTVAIMARLLQDGKVVSAPELEQVTFYTYKIIDTKTGEVVKGGSLNDQGENGDQEAKDKIFSVTAKLEEEGEFRALVAVTTPTFTRQQHSSFSISRGLVTLSVQPANEFTATPERIWATVGLEGMKLKKSKVQVIAKLSGEKTAYPVPCEPIRDREGVCEIKLEILSGGTYEISAQISGFDAENKKVQGSSETLKRTIAGGAAPQAQPQEIEIVEEEPETEEKGNKLDLILGLSAVLLSFGWTGALLVTVRKKAAKKGQDVPLRGEYSIPPELEEKIKELKAQASSERREPTAKDKAVFAVLEGSVSFAAKEAEAKAEDDLDAGGEEEGFGEEEEQEKTPEEEDSNLNNDEDAPEEDLDV